MTYTSTTTTAWHYMCVLFNQRLNKMEILQQMYGVFNVFTNDKNVRYKYFPSKR